MIACNSVRRCPCILPTFWLVVESVHQLQIICLAKFQLNLYNSLNPFLMPNTYSPVAHDATQSPTYALYLLR